VAIKKGRFIFGFPIAVPIPRSILKKNGFAGKTRSFLESIHLTRHLDKAIKGMAQWPTAFSKERAQEA
jgi:hypothetical protein